jgi:hypothetical protein
MYALTECTSTMFCIWPDDGSMSQKNFAEFLILITNIYCCVYWLNKLLYTSIIVSVPLPAIFYRRSPCWAISNMRCNQVYKEVNSFFSIASHKTQNRYLDRNSFCAFALRNVVACVQSRIHPTADFGRQYRSISLAISSFIYLFWTWSVPQCVCVCVCVCVRFSLFQSMDLFLNFFVTGSSFFL